MVIGRILWQFRSQKGRLRTSTVKIGEKSCQPGTPNIPKQLEHTRAMVASPRQPFGCIWIGILPETLWVISGCLRFNPNSTAQGVANPKLTLPTKLGHAVCLKKKHVFPCSLNHHITFRGDVTHKYKWSTSCQMLFLTFPMAFSTSILRITQMGTTQENLVAFSDSRA